MGLKQWECRTRESEKSGKDMPELRQIKKMHRPLNPARSASVNEKWCHNQK